MNTIENPVDLSHTPLARVQGYLNLLLHKYKGRKMVFLYEHPIQGQSITRPDDLNDTIVLSWQRIPPEHQIGHTFSHGTVFAGHWIDFNKMPEKLSDLPDRLEFSERSTEYWKALIYASTIYTVMRKQKTRLQEKIARGNEEIQRLKNKMWEVLQDNHNDKILLDYILPGRDAVRVSAIRQYNELTTLVPGTYLKITITENEIIALTSNIYLEDENRFGYDLGALEVHIPFDPENEINVNATPSSAYSRGGYYHPHVDTRGSVCWGDGYDLVHELQLKGEYVQILIYIEQFLKTYNPNGPYEKLHSWSDDYVNCPWCEQEGNQDNWNSLCDGCYENSWWCEWCEEERITDSRYCNGCLDSHTMCPQCDDRLVNNGETLCYSCQENYGICDECEEILKLEELEDGLCPGCREPEEVETETVTENIAMEVF